MAHVPGNIAGSPLGATVTYRDSYAPDLLFPVSRVPQRQDIGISGALPFHGVDVWNAYELSWLNDKGKPVAATARFDVPAASPNIVESKSIKLYLNSLNQTRFDSVEAVRAAMARDLSAAAGAEVNVTVQPVVAGEVRHQHNFVGILLDDLDVAIEHYEPAPHLLTLAPNGAEVEEVLVSHLLKSNCPVTGQPDWASVRIAYKGPAIDHVGLLAYIVSFRRHSGFHEHCVERIYTDLMAHCAPQRLSVYARYTRRGGLDINPFRSSEAEDAPANDGDIRQ